MGGSGTNRRRPKWWGPRDRREMMKTPKISNLYVIRLDDKANEYNAHSATHDNERKNTGDCVYVGCTVLTPEERFEQHRNDRRTNKKMRREYFITLLPKLYEQENIGSERELETYAEATLREIELAKKLESEGFIVWCYVK